MNLDKVKVGLSVRTTKLGDTMGMLIVQNHLDARKANKEGTVAGDVPAHGGDVWGVRPAGGTTGAYAFDEFEPI